MTWDDVVWYGVRQVAWHARGDYVCCTLREAASRSVVVHQVSRRRSQLPFRRAAGLVQCALFHPTKPLLFVAVSVCRRVCVCACVCRTVCVRR